MNTSKKPQPKKAVKASSAGSDFPLTEMGNARRLIDWHGKDLRYCAPWKKWLVWDGQRWATDRTLEVEKKVKKVIATLAAGAADIEDDIHRKKVFEWAARSQTAGMVPAMLSLARSELTILPEQLDANHWLLNVGNGTLDHATGELHEHRREDLITKLAPTLFLGEESGCFSWWQEFLKTTFLGDEELIAFMQRLLGYCLTGEVSEHVLSILWGKGANGKSTFVNAVLAMLGEDYAIQAPPDLLLARDGERHPTELADLHGKRLAVCSETDRGRRLNEARVKQLTGGDRVKARRMREDFWEFQPTHKVLLVTNHRPDVQGTDHGLWRRQRLIPFANCVAENQQDKELPAKLRDETPEILVWCLQGCLKWQKEGLGMPQAVEKATTAYRDEQNALKRFLDERCAIGSHCRVKLNALYADYKAWQMRNGEEPENNRSFSSKLREEGFVSHVSDGTWFKGIALKANDDSRAEATEAAEDDFG